MNDYPRAMPIKNIHKGKRVCCKCGGEIAGDRFTMVLALAPGKYLCARCEEERENIRKYGVKDADLIERVKKWSMDYEGERT